MRKKIKFLIEMTWSNPSLTDDLSVANFLNESHLCFQEKRGSCSLNLVIRKQFLQKEFCFFFFCFLFPTAQLALSIKFLQSSLFFISFHLTVFFYRNSPSVRSEVRKMQKWPKKCKKISIWRRAIETNALHFVSFQRDYNWNAISKSKVQRLWLDLLWFGLDFV